MLLEELNATLTGILGHNGMMYVNFEDFSHEKAGFFVGYINGEPVCCAGLRYESETVCEIKRVYARKNSSGTGRALMAFLEEEAGKAGYGRVILECRSANRHAVEFYLRNGYEICENYPPYDKEDDAVCMDKTIPYIHKNMQTDKR